LPSCHRQQYQSNADRRIARQSEFNFVYMRLVHVNSVNFV